MAAQESVLVVKRQVIEAIGIFRGLDFDVAPYTEAIFKPDVAGFMPREQAEKDPAYKQLIPYVIMSCQGRVLSYVRGKRAGEQRLVGLRSIGIGGHINPVDDMSLFSMQDTYLSAVEREVSEELAVGGGITKKIVALLNDDSNEVGRVHLGVVHHWSLDEPSVEKREQMITQMAFMAPDELIGVRDSMETWSQLCLDRLGEILNHA